MGPSFPYQVLLNKPKGSASLVSKVEQIDPGALNYIINNYESLHDNTKSDVSTVLTTLSQCREKVDANGRVTVSYTTSKEYNHACCKTD